MDAFIIRTPRANVKAVAKSKAPIKGQQQRRLNDLRGVVVLEDIQKYVKRLKSDKVESSEKVRILQRLAPKQPSTKIISDTGIGKVVKQLTKSEDKAIAKAARAVKTRWQSIIERRVELSLNEDKPEVQSDLETKKKRDKALELLCQAYPSLSQEILTKVEKKFFNHFRPCIGSNYRRAIRKVVIQRSKFEKSIVEQDLQYLLEKATR